MPDRSYVSGAAPGSGRGRRTSGRRRDGDLFGFALAADPSRLVVSAIRTRRPTAPFFEQAPTGRSAKLVGDDPSNFVFFGASLGLSGSTILVGAPVSQRFPSPSPPPEGLGTAHVFTESSGAWTRQPSSWQTTATPRISSGSPRRWTATPRSSP